MVEQDEIQERRAFFATACLGWVREQGFAESIHDDGTLTVYHGTSEQNWQAIQDGGQFNGFPFFALDRATAQKYSRQAGGTPTVVELRVDPAVVSPVGGYLSARIPGLSLGDNGCWSAEEDARPRPGASDASLSL